MHLKVVSKHRSEMRYLKAGEVKVKTSFLPSGQNAVLIPA